MGLVGRFSLDIACDEPACETLTIFNGRTEAVCIQRARTKGWRIDKHGRAKTDAKGRALHGAGRATCPTCVSRLDYQRAAEAEARFVH